MPPGDWDEIVARCPGGAAGVLERVREVLRIVLPREAGPAPGVDEWKEALPGWFLSACVDDRELKSCVIDKWSVRAWVHWFRPETRAWSWWDARAGADTLRIRVQVSRRPYLRGALDWLIRVAGASDLAVRPRPG